MRLAVSDLSFTHGAGARPLQEIGFSLDPGEVLCLLGPNGAGKTTLLRCLIGALTPSGGSILLDGRPIDSLSPRALARSMAYVPQATQPAFGHLVREMVIMGRSPHLGRLDIPGRADQAIAMDCLDRVGLAHLAERSFSAISGGERQLCLLARALAQQARLLILDEPAASLDFGNQLRLLDIIVGLARDGLGILMVTHHPDHALHAGSRFVALREGRVHGAGPVADLAQPGYLSALYGRGVRIIRDADGTLACAPLFPSPQPESRHVP
ncbi:ABC transporter ATP-binding protein [Paracoccus methylovorus]|uniref:ABC transporter ATP-binding protein n=2 Tax=Paracoccus TaxID=265 RepID=A0ABX7JGV4_9RHOB|nr:MULTISPECIES: ABC transporter ATP-binding protein [Paracoccus]QRZ12929.1 ABC transporter ATP-binding protein [Paracoccus methylovorus]